MNHPITRHVRRVVTSILEANELGTLSSGQDLSLVHRDPKPGVLWEPHDGNEGEAKRQIEMHPGKEWNLLVVNDEKVVNAMASFSAFVIWPQTISICLFLRSDNIIVFTGILPICRDENGLAAVLGHGASLHEASCWSDSLTLEYRNRTCRLVQIGKLSSRWSIDNNNR